MKIFFLPAALALTVSAAIAADVTVEDTAQPVAEKPEFTWSGTYFGVHAGGGWANGAFSDFGVAVEGDIERHWNEQEVFGADFGLDWGGRCVAVSVTPLTTSLRTLRRDGPERGPMWTRRDWANRKRHSAVTRSAPGWTMPSPTICSVVSNTVILIMETSPFRASLSIPASTRSGLAQA